MTSVYFVSLEGVTLVILDIIELCVELAMTAAFIYLCKKDPYTMKRCKRKF